MSEGSDDAGEGGGAGRHAGTVPVRSFEALFLHQLAPEGELLAQLQAAGFDPLHPKDMYPVVVYKDCLDLARQHLFAELPPEEGYRKLGHVWIEGFEKTVVGRVLAAAARMIGTDRCLARIPAYMPAGRTDMEADAHPIGPRAWRLVMKDPIRPLPHLTRGVLEAIVRLTGGEHPVVTVEREEPGGYELHVRW